MSNEVFDKTSEWCMKFQASKDLKAFFPNAVAIQKSKDCDLSIDEKEDEKDLDISYGKVKIFMADGSVLRISSSEWCLMSISKG